MAQPFNPAAPIEDLFEQISNRQDLAIADGVPFSEVQLVTKAYDLIFKMGVHNEACREWNQKQTADKTYLNLLDHFTRAHRKLHQLQTAARNAGYTANLVKAHEPDEELRHRTAEAIANLAEGTTSDRTAVANLSTVNTDLSQQFINLAKQVKEKDMKLTAMRRSIDDLTAALRELRLGAGASVGLGPPQKKKRWAQGRCNI
eukprot:11509720-Ditylum_brightwellii.AAC.1